MAGIDYTAKIVMTGAYLGRCKAKGCKHSTRLDGFGFGECPEHGSYKLAHVVGSHVPEIKCGAKCRNAVGPSCDCSCGGKNHGAGHGAGLALLHSH